jgi:hypothetical protein
MWEDENERDVRGEKVRDVRGWEGKRCERMKVNVSERKRWRVKHTGLTIPSQSKIGRNSFRVTNVAGCSLES